MQNNAAFVEFDAFKESSAADTLRTLLVGGKAQKEVALEHCIKSFPHAGSDKSVASELPFPSVAVWRTDAFGIVRLAGVVDSVEGLRGAAKARRSNSAASTYLETMQERE
jgi:hypothetical protein